MRLKSAVAAFCCALAFSVVGAGSALAGEITGPSSPNGGLGHPLYQTIDGQHVLNGASECAFSGLNNPLDGAEAGPGRVQSYGQIVAAGGKAFAPSPGVACNPTQAGSGEPS
jgi:hypothetical protein